MRNLTLGIIIGAVLTTGLVGAQGYLGIGGGGGYLHPTETQAVLQDIRNREALETLNLLRQNYLDGQVRDAGKPCR